jgi:hypothetical protein
MKVADLLARVAGCGFRVEVDDDTGPFLVKVLQGATLPPGVLAELKANRAAVLRFVTCSNCGRVTTCAEDRERLTGVNPFCDLGACPYKERHRA